MVGDASRAAARALIFLIELYRHMVSPLRLPTCRFVPSCSQYAVDALTEYGLTRGSWLAVVRLAKCGPWHQGGWDPVPERHNCQEGFGLSRTGLSRTLAKRGESTSLV